MGDRAIIVVKSGDEYSPCGIYFHWSGEKAIEYLQMGINETRPDDVGYLVARIIGEAHGDIDGGLSLGVIDPPNVFDTRFNWSDYSHGDAGVIVYDCGTGVVEYHGGYLGLPAEDPDCDWEMQNSSVPRLLDVHTGKRKD